MRRHLTLWGYIRLANIFLMWSFLLMVWGATVAHAVVLKVGTLSPEGSSWMEKMRSGAEEIKQKTDGRVRLKFYPGGVMGDDKAVLRKIRLGQLQGGAVVSGSLSEIYSDNQIYNLPMLFKSFEEVDFIRQKMDSIIINGLADGGFVVLGMAGGGFAYVMSQHPVSTIEDLRVQKMWVPDNDQSSLETLLAFGVKPIPLSLADVRAGLQTGLIDTVVTSPVAAIALQWHTQIKYLTETPLIYIYGVLVIDQKAFLKVSETDQPIVKEVMAKTFQEIEVLNRKDNVTALEAMRQQGVQLVVPAKDAMAQWRSEAGTVADRLIDKGRLSKGIVETLNSHIAEFRNGQSVRTP